MNEFVDPRLAAWESFYVIVGSSGAALIGLQFVVIAIIKDTRTEASASSVSAFGTPTVVHLAAALLISAIMSMPWQTLRGVSIALALAGTWGIVYGGITTRRARRQTGYAPVWDDWLWHAILPLGAYLTLAVAALKLPSAWHVCLFLIGCVALGLLFIGIHNAWDTVTYLVVSAAAKPPASE